MQKIFSATKRKHDKLLLFFDLIVRVDHWVILNPIVAVYEEADEMEVAVGVGDVAVDVSPEVEEPDLIASSGVK